MRLEFLEQEGGSGELDDGEGQNASRRGVSQEGGNQDVRVDDEPGRDRQRSSPGGFPGFLHATSQPFVDEMRELVDIPRGEGAALRDRLHSF